MCKLHLTEPHTIIKDGKEVVLTASLYNVTDEKLMKENGFFKCHKCKDFFDEANNFGDFHPQYTEEEYDYCNVCYAKIDKHPSQTQSDQKQL